MEQIKGFLILLLIVALCSCRQSNQTKVIQAEERVAYVENASEIMMGMMMSGRYESISGTNDNGKWTIRAILR